MTMQSFAFVWEYFFSHVAVIFWVVLTVAAVTYVRLAIRAHFKETTRQKKEEKKHADKKARKGGVKEKDPGS